MKFIIALILALPIFAHATIQYGDLTIKGVLTVASSHQTEVYDSNAVGAIAVTNRLLLDTSLDTSIDWQNRLLKTAAGATALSWSSTTLSAAGLSVGTLILPGSVSGSVTLVAPSTVSSYSLTMPNAQGSAGTTLINNGSGVLTWAAGGSGSATNLLLNPSFELASVATDWIVSGATATANTSNYHDGTQSISLALSASGSLIQGVASGPTFAGTNMESGFWVNTTVTTVTVCPIVNSIILTGINCNKVPATGTWNYVSANFIGPSAGTSFGAALVWTSTSGTILADQAYSGQATNLTQVSQPNFVGSVQINCTSTNPQTSSGSFASMVGAGCSYTPLGGVAVTSYQTTNQNISLNLPSGGPGVYQLRMEGIFGANTNSNVAAMRMWDGTQASNAVDTFIGYAGYGGNSMTQEIVEPSGVSNINFEIQGKDVSAVAIVLANGQPVTLSLYFYPSQSQTAVQSQCASTGSCLNTLTASVAPNCSSNPCTIATQNAPWLSSIVRNSVGTYTPTFITGFFTQPPSCQVTSASGGSGTFVFISSDPTTSSFQFVNTTTTTAQDGGFSITCDRQGSDVSSMSAPVLVGSVTSASAGAEALHRVSFGNTSSTSCTSGPCAYVNQDGNWVSSVGNGSTGSYHVAFTTAFSGPPVCTCSAQEVGVSGDTVCSIANPVASSVDIAIVVGGGSAEAFVNLICMGPR